MSMIIESLPFERRGRSSRRSAVACGVRLLVPAQISGPFARHGVKRARSVARSLERLERLAAHRGIDVQVRRPGDRAELLEHEEDHAVVHQGAPIASANQVSLFFGQPGSLETHLRIAKERLSMARL